MRLAILLLVCAAVMSLEAVRLQSEGLLGARVIEAQRSGVAANRAPNPHQSEQEPTLTDGLAIADPTPAPPLFRPSQAPEGANGVAPGERFTLIGVAGQPGARIAFVRDLGNQQDFRVREGDAVGAWRVDVIGDNCVTLRRSREQQTPCL